MQPPNGAVALLPGGATLTLGCSYFGLAILPNWIEFGKADGGNFFRKIDRLSVTIVPEDPSAQGDPRVLRGEPTRLIVRVAAARPQDLRDVAELARPVVRAAALRPLAH